MHTTDPILPCTRQCHLLSRIGCQAGTSAVSLPKSKSMNGCPHSPRFAKPVPRASRRPVGSHPPTVISFSPYAGSAYLTAISDAVDSKFASAMREESNVSAAWMPSKLALPAWAHHTQDAAMAQAMDSHMSRLHIREQKSCPRATMLLSGENSTQQRPRPWASSCMINASAFPR